MSFLSILSTLLIGPLKLIFEVIFGFANKFVDNPGLAIIFLSLIMNIMVLPLYRRADALQEQTRDTEAKLHRGVAHIKKTFSGDERMMILQTYYRQNNYKPTSALNGSVSLLLEIPFFIAAYQFLSNLTVLDGVSLGPIKDLGAPDGLIVIGGLTLNLLPILMTLINVISSALYLKGFPLKTKVQLYAMAAFFLVFLYSSPACLVFYWTLNNLFSLVKTIFYKLKNPRPVLNVICCIAGLGILFYDFAAFSAHSLKMKLFLALVAIALFVPALTPYIKAKTGGKSPLDNIRSSKKMFYTGAIFLTVFIGVFIPSVYIAASPQEYIDITYFHDPLWYIASSLCMAAGTFLVWMQVFYRLASDKGKIVFDYLVWVMGGVMLVNYMFFGTKLGVISSTLQYENGMDFSRAYKFINLLVIVVVAAVMCFIAYKWKRAAAGVLTVALIAVISLSAVNTFRANASISRIRNGNITDESEPHFTLSKNGKNVIVLMLDRAVGRFTPYFMNEKPELMEKFDGFTYYKNTLSFGACTNFGMPALAGGYEYTPVELNRRSDESLAEKHNEALKVMPVLFDDNDFDVTVCDPSYAGYQWVPDLSIFDEYPNISKYITKGRYGFTDAKQAVIDGNMRNFFCFSIMKTLPVVLQPTVYDKGLYLKYGENTDDTDEAIPANQTIDNISVANGINHEFMETYQTLLSMNGITNVSDGAKNSFLFMVNDMTHNPCLLSEPDYTPENKVDNTSYDNKNADRFTLDGKTLEMDVEQMSMYHVNMAAMIRLGEWFDYLRKNDVYDNTRIIIVSDHGWGTINEEQIDRFHPLLMVKDFNAKGYTESDEFMTNADVPTLAVKGLINDPKNPFTGKALDSSEKTAHEQYVILSSEWDVAVNNGNTFLPSYWGCVKPTDMLNESNWTFFDKEAVLTENSAP